MTPTSMARNKQPVWLCALAGIFCLVMALLCLTFPEETYARQAEEATAKLAQAQQELARQVEAAEAGLEESKALQASKTAELAQAQGARADKQANLEAAQAKLQQLNDMPAVIEQLRQTYGDKVRQLEDMVLNDQVDIKICYLTFDDGPNNLTAAILERLEAHDVYATFFTIGANSAKKQEENLRKEMMAGHTVANHSFSHAIDWGLYDDMEEFTKQVMLQDENVYNATGFHMNLFRFPSGSVKCPFLGEAEAWLEENGYKWIDWNSSAWDSGLHSFTVGGKAISSNVYHNTKDLDIAVVLCHDFNYSTYEGLNLFIPRLRDEGFIFLPLFPQSHMLDAPLPVV